MRTLAFLGALVFSISVAAADGLPDAITPDGGQYFGSLRDGRMNGRGRLEWPTGGRYEGTFQDGLFHGRGQLLLPDGRRYAGEFAKGLFEGRGRFEAPSGEIYEGDFEKGEFTGHGTYSRPDGLRYRGSFVRWRMQGEGRLTDANGDTYEGEFQNGWLANDPRLRDAGAAVESALLSQRRLLDEALAAIAPGRPGTVDLYLLAVGGDGSQEVFRREVEFVRGQFDERYGTRGRSVALVNSRTTYASAPMATVASIGEALKTIAARMNRDEDILFFFLTSHGTQDHQLKLQQNYMTLRDLPARELAGMLKASGMRWKVVVVSACYSGGFIDALKDDSTLIITAARRDRTSFGCADENDFTYFGRAFFKEALPASRSFHDAFAKADALVAEWEKKEQPKEARSLPQLLSTPAIDAQLKRWADQAPP